jgi:hypothetical protein
MFFRRTPASSRPKVVWYENDLGGKVVMQTARRIGIANNGVWIPGAFGMVAVIPWSDLHGPKKRPSDGLWNLYPSTETGDIDERQYCVVTLEVARAVSDHPGCLRRSMTTREIKVLGHPS